MPFVVGTSRRNVCSMYIGPCYLELDSGPPFAQNKRPAAPPKLPDRGPGPHLTWELGQLWPNSGNNWQVWQYADRFGTGGPRQINKSQKSQLLVIIFILDLWSYIQFIFKSNQMANRLPLVELPRNSNNLQRCDSSNYSSPRQSPRL